MEYHRWDVVDVDYGIPLGHEQGKRRPAIVISNDGFNRSSNMAAVLPITSRQTAKYPSEVEIPTLPNIVERGVVMTQQIRAVDGSRLVAWRGPLKDPVLQRQIQEALARFLGIVP